MTRIKRLFATAALAVVALFFPLTGAAVGEALLNFIRQPEKVSAEASYFTVAGDYPSFAAASQGATALRRKSGDLTFAVFAPYGERRTWSVMAASYALRKDAEFAADYLTTRGLSTSPAVFSLNAVVGRPPGWIPEEETPRNRVISCLGEGASTIGDLFACSGYLLTPASFSRCLIGGECAVEPVSISSEAYLRTKGLSMDSPLSVLAPGFVNSAHMNTCKGRAENAEAYVACVVLGGEGVGACVGKSGDDLISCLTEGRITPENRTFFDCVNQAKPDDVLSCASGGNAKAFGKARACVEEKGDMAAALAGCLGTSFKDKDVAMVRCALGLKDGKTSPLECLSGRPDWKSGAMMVKCMRGAGAAEKALVSCAREAGLGLGMGVENCAAAATLDPDGWQGCISGLTKTPETTCLVRYRSAPDELAVCLSQGNATLRDAVKAYRCLSRGTDAAELIEACGEGLMDNDTRRTASCLARAQGDKKRSAVCLASRFMGEKEAKLVGCVTEAQGYASYALCAAGLEMNQEWTIAAECVSYGGEAIVIAGCIVGRLAVAELGKCFSGGIGGEGGCFGPNNTIVKFVSNAADDITKGPGPNNEVVKVVRNVGKFLGL